MDSGQIGTWTLSVTIYDCYDFYAIMLSWALMLVRVGFVAIRISLWEGCAATETTDPYTEA